jgi:Ca-activated chloride channel family protein
MRDRRVFGCRQRNRLRILPVLLALVSVAAAQDLPQRGFETPTVSAARRPPATSGTSERRMTVEVRNVLVPVTVTDPLGRPVAGLPRNAFKVLEDDVEQRVSYFANEAAPVSLGILFDASASMEKKIDKSRDAVARLFESSMPGDEYFLVEFNDAPHLLAPFTTDVVALQDRLAFIQPKGWTALIDAIYLAVARMKEARNGRKALLILSDGADNNSRFTETEVKSMLRESDVSVYAIGILGEGVSKRSMRLLSGVADESGGQMFQVSKTSQLPEAIEKISDALRDQYVLGYRPSNSDRDGKFRRVRVKIAPPADLPPLHISWRTGYYAPY